MPEHRHYQSGVLLKEGDKVPFINGFKRRSILQRDRRRAAMLLFKQAHLPEKEAFRQLCESLLLLRAVVRIDPYAPAVNILHAV